MCVNMIDAVLSTYCHQSYLGTHEPIPGAFNIQTGKKSAFNWGTV